MTVELVTIGDELLIGQIVDTNSAWMANAFHDLGIEVVQITSISDNAAHIKETLDKARKRAEVVIITGGLGPTKDDITKNTLAEYFNDSMVFYPDVLEHIEALFASFNRVMPAINKHQAELPASCTPLINKKGTAPGMWFQKDDVIVVSLPGVPYEMKYLMQNEVLPRLQKLFGGQELLYKTIVTQGIGESSLMEIIGGWEEELIAEGLSLAWLPTSGSVRLRISHRGSNRLELESKIDNYVSSLQQLIPEYFIGHEHEALEVELGSLLQEKNWTISTAESCTGGYVAHMLTSVSGSSGYFEGSVVSYSNRVKESVLGVSWHSLKEHGAVSQQVVEEMVVGVKRHLGTDCAIATSGVAGPSGGSEEKPVGLVWIAVATPHGVFSKRYRLGKDRIKNIEESARTSLRFLKQQILEKS